MGNLYTSSMVLASSVDDSNRSDNCGRSYDCSTFLPPLFLCIEQKCYFTSTYVWQRITESNRHLFITSGTPFQDA